MRAIELNDVAVEKNKAAFEWGRWCAHDWNKVRDLLRPAQTIAFQKRESLENLLNSRIQFLTAYQNPAYAKDYERWVGKVLDAEKTLNRTTLTETVARNLFKLMAYKDEYEVARLHTQPDFLNKLKSQFDGSVRLKYHLAPPLLARRNEKGELMKSEYGPWMLHVFGLIARLKFLRGTHFDPFGQTLERRAERALIQEYKASLEEIIAGLTADNHSQAIEIAKLPEGIKGFGHVKEKNIESVRLQWKKLMNHWRNPGANIKAA